MNSPHPIVLLRAELDRLGLDGFLVPRADEHLGEYVPPCAERLAYLTGFTGSAGMAVVLRDRAAVFTDGRYTLQLAQQTDPALWEQLHITEDPPPAWVARTASAGARIGYDPWLFSEEGVGKFTAAGLTLQPVAQNPLDTIWADRPAPPRAAAIAHELVHAGRSSVDKRHELAGQLRAAGEAAAVISDPASIAWLLNIRGSDVDYTPSVLSFAILHEHGQVDLFVAPEKILSGMLEWLGNEVAVHAPDELGTALAALAGSRVRVDPAASPAWFAQTLRARGAEVVGGADPCTLPKACKNVVEQQGARDAQARDAVAVCRYLHYLSQIETDGAETEMSAAARLLAFRAELPGFRGESFPAISGAGAHGAIIHYRASAASNRAIRPGELYLIDSGAQFADGTTDITRTVWIGAAAPPDDIRENWTRVLKGMIAIATLVFPAGIAGPHVDAFARRALWAIGLDYDHGTGHGVGSYLSVHEGPAGLSRVARMVPFAPGMILSDEPGYYLPDHYGIRLENLLLVQTADLPGAKKPFLRFETLTLAPFDRRLVMASLLDRDEIAWLDAFHARVLAAVGPCLAEPERDWLVESCLPIGP